MVFKMKILVKKNVVKREKGYLYFIDGKGDLYKAKLKRGGKKLIDRMIPNPKQVRKNIKYLKKIYGDKNEKN